MQTSPAKTRSKRLAAIHFSTLSAPSLYYFLKILSSRLLIFLPFLISFIVVFFYFLFLSLLLIWEWWIWWNILWFLFGIIILICEFLLVFYEWWSLKLVMPNNVFEDMFNSMYLTVCCLMEVFFIPQQSDFVLNLPQFLWNFIGALGFHWWSTFET